MKLYLTICAALFILISCKEETGKKQVKTTPNGWEYDYIDIPEKTDGWKIVFMAKSAWIFGDANPWASVLGPYLFGESGYADVTPADKRTFYEEHDSNTDFGQERQNVSLYLYAEEGEEEEFMNAVIANLNQPNLDEEIFDQIKTHFKNDLLEYQNTSDEIQQKMMSYALYHQSVPKMRSDQLTIKALEALTIADIEAWVDHALKLDGWKIAVAGGENPEILEPYIDELLKNFSQNPSNITYKKDLTNKDGKTITYQKADLDKVSILMQAPWSETLDAKGFAALEIAANIMGAGEVTRLADIRDELRASYGFQGGMDSLTPYSNGLWISGESDVAQQSEVLETIDAMIEDFQQNPITEDEFKRVIDDFVSSLEEANTDENFVSYVLARNANAPYPMESLTDPEFYKNLSYDEISALIMENFPSRDQWTTTIVTPDTNGLDMDCAITSQDEIAGCY